MKIFYTHHAIYDLQYLHRFVATKNTGVANAVKNKLLQAVNRLVDFPMLGREIKGQEISDALRELITGDYVIRYAILKNEVHILRIWHGKENREHL